jgi:hypothetical protein
VLSSCDSELHLRVIIRLLASFSCSFFDCVQEVVDLDCNRFGNPGSWFSDCIGASSSLVVVGSWGSISRQIEFISTHRKIGHSSSIKWYQLPRLIGEFYRVFHYLQSIKPQKIFRLDLCPSTLLRLALSLNFVLLNLRASASIVAGYFVFDLFPRGHFFLSFWSATPPSPFYFFAASCSCRRP